MEASLATWCLRSPTLPVYVRPYVRPLMSSAKAKLLMRCVFPGRGTLLQRPDRYPFLPAWSHRSNGSIYKRNKNVSTAE